MDKAKEVARAAKATSEASKQRFYDLGMQETKACLIEKLAGVYREYC